MERFTKFFTSLGGVLASLAAIVGGIVALYVAFGGGGDSSSTNPPAPAVVGTTSSAALEDWRSEAEDVCRNAERQAEALGPDPDPSDQPAQVERLRQLIPIVEGFTNEVRALDEPSEIQADAARMIAKMDQTTELAHTLVNSYQAGDAASAERARLELQGVSVDADRAMADLGLKNCVAFS